MWFSGQKKEISKIDIFENKIVIDDKILSFPLALADIEEVLGKPSREYKTNREWQTHQSILYIYDSMGIVFEADLMNTFKNYYKKCNVYIDEYHTIYMLKLYFGNKVVPMYHDTIDELPKKICKAKVTFESRTPYFFSDRGECGDFRLILWAPYGEDVCGEIDNLTYPLSITFSPKRISEPANYTIKKNVEDALHFDNMNFKLAIIQVLMYELEVLEPYFDIYDFALQYRGKEIDTESDKIIKPALNFFKKLPIPKALASKVEEIYMDGGNNIYMNIIPQWSGEDGTFDLNEITLEELQQFPNLKKATIMSSNFDEIKTIFENAGIEVETV